MKKVSSLLLTFLILIGMFFVPYNAFARVKSGEGEAVLLQEGEYDILEAGEYKMNAGAAAVQSVEDYIYNALLSCSASIDVTSFKVPVNNAVALYSDVVNDHADLFYVSSSISYNYYPSNNTLANLYPAYTMTSAEINDAKAIFDAGAQKVLSGINSSMNDIQKAVYIHDAVCSLAHYPQVEFETDDKDIYHSAYGLFYDGEVVCAGYALAYSYLLNEAGVECEYVSSDPMAHAWNKVKIGNSWYNVDVTWDDLDFSSTISIQGSMTHHCFLRSDSKFSTLECSYHYDGVTYDECTADDTQYDTAFWDDVNSCIYTVDGDFYYLDPNFDTRYAALVKRTPEGVETEVKNIRVGVRSNFSSVVEDKDGNQTTVSNYDLLARITLLDNRFYIGAGKTLYSVRTDGKMYTITTFDDYTQGIASNETGNLIQQGYSSSDTENELDKLLYFNTYTTLRKGQNYNNYPDINYDEVINAKDYAMIIKN